VLERPIPGFDHSVNGKALGRAGKVLEVLAEKTGAKPLMDFFSVSPEELSEFAAGHGVEVEQNATRSRHKQWFAPDEGLVTIRALREVARTERIEYLDKVLADLDEFERVLGIAKEHGVGWHLAVDY